MIFETQSLYNLSFERQTIGDLSCLIVLVSFFPTEIFDFVKLISDNFKKKTSIFYIMLGKQTKRRTQLTQTFQSQINDEGGSRFLMDKTLYKGIKDNDVSKIIDVSKDSGQLTDKPLPSELQQLEKIVVQMRRKYDEARTNITQVQSQLQKLRKTSETLKAQEARLKQTVGGAKNTLQSKQKQSETLFTNVEARNYDLDIYKQLVATLKHDILVIKKRNFEKDMALKQERTRIKSLKNDDFHKTQLSHKCRGMLQSVQKAVISKQYERNSKLNTFYEALNKKHQNIRKKDERESEIQEIMIKAMSQKLQEQKQWINICHVNLFLKKFLKCKMERLISQNAEVQGAYHKIRSNTDIKDCKDLITRFLNRQRDYGTLLGSISEKEVKLQNQKYQKQQLEAKNHELRHLSEQISESVHKNRQSDDPLQKELNEVQQALKQIQSKKQLMKKWATRFYCSFSNKSREQINKKYQNKPSTQLIKDVLCQITKFLDHLLGDQNCSNNINNAFMSTRPSDKTFDQDMVNRNKRVKASTLQDQYVQGDDRDGLYDGGSQAEFLNYNRRMTKKNDLNRRFRIKTQLK